MPGRLIINADDFGLTPGINRAVLELHDAGVLKSATLMAGGPAFQEAAVLARSRPALGVGCHLVFVDGVPTSPPETIPSLLGSDGRSFRASPFDLAQATLRGVVRHEELARETHAQIQRLQHAGIAVTHVDTHKHVHVLPALARTILQAAKAAGVPRFRNPFEPRWSRALSRPSASFAHTIIWETLNSLSPLFPRQHASHHGELTTAGTLGVLATGTFTPALLRACLNRLSAHEFAVFELCVHPGYVDASLDAVYTRLQESRASEISILLEVVPEVFSHRDGPLLLHYGNLHADS